MSRFPLALVILPFVLPVAHAQAPPDRGPVAAEVGPALPDGAIARVGTLRLRHRGAVRVLAFLPDGRLLASLGSEHDFRLWDATTGAETRWLQKHVDSPRRADRLELLLQGRGGTEQQTTAFSPDGKVLAVSEPSGIIRLWDIVADREVKRFQVKEQGIHAVVFSPNGKQLAAGGASEQGTVHVWDVASGKEVWQLQSPHNRPVKQFAFAPDGRYLVGSSLNELRVWDLTRGKRARVYQGHENSVTVFAISPDGKRVASAGDDQTVRLWEESSEEEVGRLTMTESAVTALAFTPDGKAFVTAAGEQPLRLWDAVTTKEIKHLGEGPIAATALAFSPDGKTLASGGPDGTVRLWDVAKGTERAPLKDPAELVSVAFIERGRRIVLGGADGTVRHCDPSTGKVLRRFEPAENKERTATFAPACGIVALTGEEGAVVVRDIVKGKDLFNIKESEGVSVTFSPDGKLLAITGGQPLQTRLVDAATGKELRQLGEGGVGPMLAFAPGGQAVAGVGDDGRVCLWEVSTGKVRRRFRGPPGSIRCLAFAPGGRLLATGSDDETIRLWDIITGKLKRGLVGHRGGVVAVVFSPDGRRLASGSEDGAVRVWDVESGEEQRRFDGHRGRVGALAFSPDGRRLVSGSEDATAVVWDLDVPVRAAKPADTATRRLERLWADLASEDADVAFAAHGALVEIPREAIAFLRDRLRPVPRADPAFIVQMIADLDGRRFAARDLAMRELGRLEGQAAPALRRALAANPSAEVQKRLKTLLERVEAAPTAGPELRVARAVELLEQLNTGESRRLLDELLRGAPGARLTEEARAALRRLAKRANADMD